jgi:hypothetical protein
MTLVTLMTLMTLPCIACRVLAPVHPPLDTADVDGDRASPFGSLSGSETGDGRGGMRTGTSMVGVGACKVIDPIRDVHAVDLNRTALARDLQFLLVRANYAKPAVVARPTSSSGEIPADGVVYRLR